MKIHADCLFFSGHPGSVTNDGRRLETREGLLISLLVLHCHTQSDNKGKAKFCTFKIFQIFLPQNPAYFVSKKLTYTDKKRHSGALQRGDDLVHVNGITYIEADLKLNHLRILMALISELQRALRLRITRGNERKGVPEVFLPPKTDQGLRVLTIPVTAFHLGKSNGLRLRECLDELSRIGIRSFRLSSLIRFAPEPLRDRRPGQ